MLKKNLNFKFENIEFSVNEAGELINYFIRLDNLFKVKAA